MLKQIYFVPLLHAERIEGRPNIIVVSIHDRHYRPNLRDGFGGVLSLKFDDYDPDLDGITRDRDVFSHDQADTLHAWIETYASSATPFTLLVHCYGGISRSAAVAWWAYRTYQHCGLELKTDYPLWYLNRHVLRVLDSNIQAPRKPDDASVIPPDRSFEPRLVF